MYLLKVASFGGQLLSSNVSSSILCNLRELPISNPIAVPWRPGIQVIFVPLLSKYTPNEGREKKKNFTENNENVSYFDRVIKCGCLRDSVVTPDLVGLTSLSESRQPGFKSLIARQMLHSVGESFVFLALICLSPSFPSFSSSIK